MNIGDIVYLKSGSPAMTIVGLKTDGLLVYWMGGPVLQTGIFPEAALISTNPEPAISNDTQKLRQALEAGAESAIK